MDIKKQPIEIQKKWLQQRGWQPRSDQIWVDPDTRVGYFFTVALDRALSECRIDSDFQLKPDAPPRKDDAPPVTDGGGWPRK